MSVALQETTWIGPSEAGRRIGCSAQWVKEIAKSGLIASYKSPLGLLLDADDVEAYARRRAQMPKDTAGRLLKRKSATQPA